MGRQINFNAKQTLSPANQFHFVCPIFNVETPIATCLKLRDIVWAGKQPPQRQGCQACMSASKCPINGILTDMLRNDTDPYFSAEKRVGTLRTLDLARVSNIKVLDMHLRGREIPARELELIHEANEKASIAGAAKTAKTEERGRKPRSERPVELDGIEVDRHSTKPTVDAVTAAAIAGDMSAAINAAIATKPEPAPTKPAEPMHPAPAVSGARPLSLIERVRLAKETKVA